MAHFSDLSTYFCLKEGDCDSFYIFVHTFFSTYHFYLTFSPKSYIPFFLPTLIQSYSSNFLRNLTIHFSYSKENKISLVFLSLQS